MKNIISTIFLAFFTLSIAWATTAPAAIASESNQDEATIAPSVATLGDTTATKEIYKDNAEAVDMIRQSQAADMSAQLTLEALSEQLNALKERDASQRRAIQSQLAEVRAKDSLRKEGQKRQIDSLKQHSVGAPVMLKRDTLLYIYTKRGSFTPSERAALNSSKILSVAKVFSLKSDSLVVMDTGTSSDIMYNDISLLSISDFDAIWMDSERDSLAGQYKEIIHTAIIDYRESIGVWNILKMVGLALLVVLFQFGLFKGVATLFKRLIDKKLVAKKDTWFKGISIGNLELFGPRRQLKLILGLSKLVKITIYIIILYISIPMLFSIFPATQNLASTLFNWILTPFSSIFKAIYGYLPNLLKIAAIIFVSRYALKFIKYVMGEIGSGKVTINGFYADWASSVYNIIRIFVYAFMLIFIFPMLPGNDSKTFQGISAFIGLIITLGSTSVIANLMAGLVITFMRPFKVGDRIRIGDTFGDVMEKTPFMVRVKTIKQEIVTVPNSTILSNNVTNYSTSAQEGQGLILYTTVTISYDVKWEKANEILLASAKSTDLVLAEPAPFVLSENLGDNAASYQINVYTKHANNQSAIYSQLNKNIMDNFHAAGIELVSPLYRSIRDGNEPVLPKE